MKTIHHTKLALGLWLLSAAPLLAQTFDSGSNGSYGPLNPTSNTNLDMPPDGIFHCTTINIPVSVRVFFNRNNLNTPVYLLAQSNVVISGYISVNGGSDSGSNPGRAGPGGFDGGFGAIQSYPASDGQGPGGGSVAGNNNAVFAFPQGANTNVYGNTLISPLIGGSGGAGGAGGGGGGGGGGAILIASSTRVTLNTLCGGGNCQNIDAQGGYGTGYGSGGAVRIVAPVVDGNGGIYVYGVGNSGYGGRIRIDTLDRYAWRSLILAGGKWTVGSQMYVFPPNNPRLDIVEAAGQPIAAGITNQVLISLPPGASTNQTVRVQATGFTNDVPVTVAVAPEAGASARFDGVISISSTNPVTGTVNVVIPADSFCNVSVWTR